MKGMMKAFAKGINKMISWTPGWLLGGDKKEMKISMENIEKLDYSGYKVDPQKAASFGKKLNSPIKSAKSAMDSMISGGNGMPDMSDSGMSRSKSQKKRKQMQTKAQNRKQLWKVQETARKKGKPVPKLPQNQPATKKEDKSTKIENNVQISGEGGQGGNQARVRQAVREGLKQANKRQRMQNTDMN